MNEYILWEFEYGYTGQVYQEINNGQVIRYCDLDGNTLTLEGEYGYTLINVTPERPSWAL
jgi:hypothetical protein